MKKQLQAFFDKYPRSFTQKLRTAPHVILYKWFLKETEYLEQDIPNIKLRAYVFLNELDKIPAPLCPLCQTVISTRTKNWHWTVHCSRKCKSTHNSLVSRDKAKDTAISNWGVDNPAKSPIVRSRMKETMLKRHGVEFAKQSTSIQEKTKKTMLERYGVEFPMQSASFKEKINNTLIKRYGVQNAGQIPLANVMHLLSDPVYLKAEHKTKSITEIANNLNISPVTVSKAFREFKINVLYHNRYTSELETKIGDFIKQSTRTRIELSVRSVIPPYELDMYLPELKIAFEINGSYWHSELLGKTSDYHLKKTSLCHEQGIQLIHIWEHDWLANPDLIKSRIQSKIGTNARVFGRKCTLGRITSTIATEFLNKHHIQRNCPASVRYGLFYENELIAVMTFGKSRYKKDIEYELLRYCSKQGINVVGGASKLFKGFIREYEPESIISYSDRMWNTGGLYAKLGFVFSHSSPPNYRYTSDYLNFESRVIYQKHKLSEKLNMFDPLLTEWENMQANGYDRIWDCGNDVWVYEFT